jgi:23S rRNA pseudouridine1911/1915/1917 synthase
MANLEYTTRERLDVWLMKKYPDFSRAFLQKLCNEDKVLVNGEPQKSGYKLRGGEEIVPQHDMKAIIGLVPDIELPILYEDDNVIVINKPAGVLSHGLSKFLGEPSVASFLRQRHIANQKGDWKAEDLRFGIVHRLDRVTSGVMICAKNQDTMRFLQKQFHDRKVEKTYRALVEGELKHDEALLDLPIERNPKAPATFRVGANGKVAQTTYKVLKVYYLESSTLSLVELTPKTGRTHQLRVHLVHIKHPIVGDKLYNGKAADRLYLHAYKLTIEIPGKGQQTFVAEMPDEFEQMVVKSES